MNLINLGNAERSSDSPKRALSRTRPMPLSVIGRTRDRAMDVIASGSVLRFERSVSLPSGTVFRIDGSVAHIEKFSENKAAIQDDLIALFRDHPKLAEVRFDEKKLSSETKRMLANALAENHPMLGILRIMPKDRVVTFMIDGVKPVNDVLSQDAANIVLAALREPLERRFDRMNLVRITSKHNKIVATSPQRSGFSIPTQAELDAFVKETLSENSETVLTVSRRLGKSPKEIVSAVQSLRISVGESRMPSDGTDLAKLEAAYESELAARRSAASFFGVDRVARIRSIQELERGIVEKFNGKEFTYGGQSYPAVAPDAFGRSRPHPLLAEIVRKTGGKDSVQPAELVRSVEKYMNALNRELDYVAPVADLSGDF